MPKYTLGRNYTLVTMNGRAIEFIKDRPTHVPPECVRAAIGIGALPVDGSDVSKEFEEPKLPKAPTDAAERLERIMEVVRQLIERNDRDDFSANGLPNLKVVERILGWKVDKREIQQVWAAYCQEQADIQERMLADERAARVLGTE